jgi:Mg/Co/Ni transporter MgtE
VDTSFNGFLRRWGLGRLRLLKDDFIPWKYVQPLSVEDALATDKVSLSITRRQLKELPSEDLADALEELSGAEQTALFLALDSEKAAETLVEAEPRAQRQLIAGMRTERARTVLSEMSVPQLADLFSVLPHDQATGLIELLPAGLAPRLRAILSEREAMARALMSSEFVAVPKDVTVGDALRVLRGPGREAKAIAYVYVVGDELGTLVGVADLRDLVLAAETTPIADVMVAPVITAEEEDLREDVEALFAKYHFRMLPVADRKDRLLGVIHYNDVMRGLVTNAKV